MIKGQNVKAKGKVLLKQGCTFRGNKLKSWGKDLGFVSDGVSVGTIEKVYDYVVLVQLSKPITSNFKKHYFAYVNSDLLTVLPENSAKPANLNKYYAKTKDTTGSVNVRLSASLTGVIKSKLRNGSLIGESDGKATGNFLKFNLASGGVGYVSKDYVSTVQTEIKEVVSTVKVAELNPLTGVQTTVEEKSVETGEGWTLKEIIEKSLIGAVVVFLATKLFNYIASKL